jgi:hypothetical protein
MRRDETHELASLGLGPPEDVNVADDGAATACPQCLALDATCRRCAQHGALAVRWLRDGLTVQVVARRLRLTRERVLRLVEEALDRKSLREYRNQRPRVEDARMFIELALARDEELTRAEIARRMKPPMHPADFDHAFGYAKASVRAGEHVSVPVGSRLMLALGRDPRELPGC